MPRRNLWKKHYVPGWRSRPVVSYPRLHEIPDVGLYLEQVTRYVNGVLEGCGIRR